MLFEKTYVAFGVSFGVGVLTFFATRGLDRLLRLRAGKNTSAVLSFLIVFAFFLFLLSFYPVVGLRLAVAVFLPWLVFWLIRDLLLKPKL
jgi:hypothetical protein